VGEVMNGDPEITSFFAGGAVRRGIDTGLDTPFDFPVCFALRNTLAHDKPMTELAKILRQDALYPHPERLVTFIGNHDTTRFVTEAGGSTASLKLALGLVSTLRGMPQIYSGDEIGMEGGADPDNRHDFAGGFAGDARSAFTEAGRTATENDIFSWTSGLLALRAAHPALQTGIEEDLFADENAFVFLRARDEQGCSPDHASDGAHERFLIVVNKGGKSEHLDLPTAETALAGCSVFQAVAPASGTPPLTGGGKLQIEEPAGSMTVYEVR
jgi:glycosidase